MLATQIMVPCIEFSSQCRVDWSAVSAVGGWLSAIATFLAVYVPARNYRIENKKRAERERRVSIVEINRAMPKILDIRGQARTIRKEVIPHITQALARGDSNSAELVGLLRIKGSVPFVILSDGLEMISIGMSNLQAALDGVNDFLNSAAEIQIYANHPLHRLQDFDAGLGNIETAANNVLLAIKKLTNIELVLDQPRDADT